MKAVTRKNNIPGSARAVGTRSLPLLICAMALLGATMTFAQDDGRGFYAALEFHSSHVGADDPTDSSPAGAIFVDEVGAGGALQLGYGLSESFLLRLNVSGSEHDTSNEDIKVQLNAGTIEGVYLFQPGATLRPYLFGGVGGFQMESQKDALSFKTDGPGMVLGAGLFYFLGNHFALNFSLRGEWINWETTTSEVQLPDGGVLSAESPVDEAGFAGKFAFGVAYGF